MQSQRHVRRAGMRTGAVLVGLVSVGVLAGCVGTSDAGSGGEASGSVEDQSGAESFGLSPVDSVTELVPDDLKDKTLSVAIYTDGAPQQFLEDDKVVGIQADFAQAVSEVAGLDFSVAGIGSWDSIIPGLQTGRFDSAFADFGITEERQEVFDLVYQFDLPTGFAVQEGSDLSLEVESDLCGTTLATVAGSFFIDQVEDISARCVEDGNPEITIQTFPSQTDSILAVSTGRTQVYAVSSDQLAYAAEKENSGLQVEAFEYAPVPQGIGVTKDSPLGAVYVEALKVLIDDGTYQDILDKWGISTAAITADQVVINPL